MPLVLLASLAALVVGVLVAAVATYRKRRHPDWREQRRRLAVSRLGRLSNALVHDTHGGLVHYTYTVNGVDYAASQDVSRLAERLPADLDRLIGPASVKYLPRNPANSILLSEEWSGLRPTPIAQYAGERQGAYLTHDQP